MVKVYIAGLLWEEKERKKLEGIDRVCRALGFTTYLPHRDTGVYKDGMEQRGFFEKNVEMLEWCEVVVALLDWKGVGSGTAWELGYAFAKGKKVVGVVEDKKSVSKEFRTCVMCFNGARIVEGVEEMRVALKELV